MKRRLSVVLFAALALRPAIAAAQFAPVPAPIEYLQFMGAGDAVVATWGGVLLGPYEASFASTTQSFSIYCVDYYHHAGSQQVASTSLTSGQADVDMGATRLGTGAGSYDKYKQAAYLSSLFESYAGASNQRTVWSGLHAAIWSITSGATMGSGATATWREYFLGLAVPETAGDGWYVLSATSTPGGQEFLVRTPVSVPEPATLLLMATGIVLLVGVGIQRRKELASLGV